MDSQTVTQTINLLVGPGVPNTGFGPTQSSPLLPLAIGTTLTLLIACLLTWYFLVHRSRNSHNSHSHSISKLPKLSSRSFSILVLLALTAALLATNLPIVSAAPTLSLGTDQGTIQVTVPQGGGTATATTTLISGTANTDGYTLTATLTEPEPGIAIKLKGGNVTNSIALNAGDSPLTLKTTNSASSNDTTDVTLSFTVDSSVKSGTKELKLAYKVADNATSAPVTMQDLTADYCQNSMVTYDGTNESAVVSLNDPRGDGQTYRVAKLADGNCWMLDNLKLGSTTGTTALTPADSNINANFSLPQLATTGTGDLDNPKTYGPVPGDTGVGATNYGYLYNWSAATAGESRTSHDETAGDAPYSICPANWRLPIGGEYNSGVGEFADLDRAFGGTGMYAASGEPNIAKWQHDGPFKGTFAGYWSEGFDTQGDGAVLWSRSAFPGDVVGADFAGFDAGGVGPGGSAPRGFGLAVRCLLN